MKINNYNITIPFGDSLNFVYRNDDYELNPAFDTVTMTIKKKPTHDAETVMIIESRDINKDGVHFNIRKEEMKEIPIGNYYYDLVVENHHIKWTLTDKPKRLKITEVVHNVL